MKKISIIRDRGQLTIPDKFRDSVDWLYPNAVVSISMTDEETLVIAPAKLTVDWKKIALLRAQMQNSQPGSTRSALASIKKDRSSH